MGYCGRQTTGTKRCKRTGFRTVDQARITTAISELARNIYLYAGKGQIGIEQVADRGKKGLKIIAEDQGPGIPDIRKVMEDGFSTSGGLERDFPA